MTYELEHVAAAVGRAAAEIRPLGPSRRALEVTQDRLAERRFLEEAGAAVAPWREVRTRADLDAAAAELGWPLRLKAAIGGYDGRSQVRLAGPADFEASWQALERSAAAAGLLLERELDFACELSVVVARGFDGRAVPFAVGPQPARRRDPVRDARPGPGSGDDRSRRGRRRSWPSTSPRRLRWSGP